MIRQTARDCWTSPAGDSSFFLVLTYFSRLVLEVVRYAAGSLTIFRSYNLLLFLQAHFFYRFSVKLATRSNDCVESSRFFQFWGVLSSAHAHFLIRFAKSSKLN